jgi:thiamine-phosphate pyrophosphorylase
VIELADDIIGTSADRLEIKNSLDEFTFIRRLEKTYQIEGKEDMPVAEARAILGEGKIIGATVNSFEDIEAHINGSLPDYFGCGPFRFTTTKKRLAPTLGIEGYREIISHMHERDITIPIVAIGGITKTEIPQILATGIDGIALSGSVLQATNPVKEMQDIVSIINHFNN